MTESITILKHTYQNVTINLELQGHLTLDEMLEHYKSFLLAIGYQISSKAELGVIDEE